MQINNGYMTYRAYNVHYKDHGFVLKLLILVQNTNYRKLLICHRLIIDYYQTFKR